MTAPRRSPGRPVRLDPPADGSDSLRDAGRYPRIYAIVRTIPRGRVATYGQVAAIEGSATARMVGYALAALPGPDRDVPWQRVLNHAGMVSERSGGGGVAPQRQALEAEGVSFDAKGRIDFDVVGWDGPDIDWLDRHGFHPAPRPRSTSLRRRWRSSPSGPVIRRRRREAGGRGIGGKGNRRPGGRRRAPRAGGTGG